MSIFDWNTDEAPPDGCRGGAVSVGNFDGVHRGHAMLVSKLVEQADRVEGPAVVITFDPHPIALLAPERLQPPLTTLTDRSNRLQTCGADHVLILRTTSELLRLEPRAFLDEILGERLGVKAVVEGFNFRFGRDRAGDNDLLAEWCRARDISLTVVPPVIFDDAVASSSRVRNAVETGNMWTATRLLSGPYRLAGVVGVGAKRGRTLGFPTANLEQLTTLVPRDGVYAVRVFLADGSVWPGAANIGPNPTFGEQERKVEVHVIGFNGDLYGQPIAMDFVNRIRDTQQFANVAELKTQLGSDVRAARTLVG